MSFTKFQFILIAIFLTSSAVLSQQSPPKKELPAIPKLPEPFATPSAVKYSKVIGWPEGRMPTAPPGFRVNALSRLESPRWLYVLPNGDILVAQSRTLPKPKKDEKKQQSKPKEPETSPNKITLLRGIEKHSLADVQETFLENLNQPFGMVLVENTIFVANTNAVIAYPYESGQKRITAKGMKILDLPQGGYNNHWTRNIINSRDGQKLYVSVGSASNCGEHGSAEELLRANILEVNRDGTALRIFASGLRNPVGMDWEPTTGKLWTAVNERDELGDDLVPDYLTSVRDGGFYGWPFSYFGSHEDPRRKGERPDLVKKAIVPDFPLGAHTASLGLTFYRGKSFPEKFHNGAFIGQRGSWNRSEFAGYRVAFVPFANGSPSGKIEDFLTGFLANEKEAYGRPVGVAVAADGSLLVADEPGNTVWRVSRENAK